MIPKERPIPPLQQTLRRVNPIFGARVAKVKANLFVMGPTRVAILHRLNMKLPSQRQFIFVAVKAPDRNPYAMVVTVKPNRF